MIKKLFQALYCLALLPVVAIFAAPASAFAPEAEEEKVYVAVEGEGKIAVYDTASRQRIHLIDLAGEHEGTPSPHNVQVAPDGKTVWVTANGGGHQDRPAQAQASDHESMGHSAAKMPVDEVIVINPGTDAIIKRIPLAAGLHLAHVVLTPDSAYAYVSAQNESTIYKINAHSYQVEGKISAPPASQPHGLRIATDGASAYIALLQGKGLGVLNLQTDRLNPVPLSGAPVQTAVTPDGRMVLASLYDSRQIAVYDTENKAIRTIKLPKTARGPVQLYSTPDSRYAYVADQGHYFKQPDSEWIYKIDLKSFQPIWAIKGGKAPHGIVISKDGKYAYVTNLVSDDLSIIDLGTDQEVARLPVGRQPNGVSIWNKKTGGTP